MYNIPLPVYIATTSAIYEAMHAGINKLDVLYVSGIRCCVHFDLQSVQIGHPWLKLQQIGHQQGQGEQTLGI